MLRQGHVPPLDQIPAADLNAACAAAGTLLRYRAYLGLPQLRVLLGKFYDDLVDAGAQDPDRRALARLRDVVPARISEAVTFELRRMSGAADRLLADRTARFTGDSELPTLLVAFRGAVAVEDACRERDVAELAEAGRRELGEEEQAGAA
jgi:hypothetical protein